jgi:large repetitive protein
VDSIVIANPTPVSAFRVEDALGGTPGRIQLFNHSQGAETFYWEFSNGQTSEEENPVTTFTEDGNYRIQLTTMNKFGCVDTTFYIYEMLFRGLFIPNAFAPTSEIPGASLFKPVGINLKSYHIMVFDNFGRMMWESEALDSQGRPTEGWDGYYDGRLQQQGTYMWKVEAIFIDGSPWKGNVIGKGETSTMGTVALIR